MGSVLGTGRQHATSVRARFVGVQRRLHLDEHILLTSCTCQDEACRLLPTSRTTSRTKTFLAVLTPFFRFCRTGWTFLVTLWPFWRPTTISWTTAIFFLDRLC